ncbi:hypothetical protein GCM10029992_36640 [Glycomyces albus]
MSDTTTPERQIDSDGGRGCAEPNCDSDRQPPEGYDTCESCAWQAFFSERERQLLDQINALEAALAATDAPRPGPLLRALLGHFGPGAAMGLIQALDLRAGDVLTWPWTQVRAVVEADRRDCGSRYVEVSYAHGPVESVPAFSVHLVLRPGDRAAPCDGCGRAFTEGAPSRAWPGSFATRRSRRSSPRPACPT